ncbi:MAG TPA: response regulator [Pyrinomonadaceae bacterium]|jgi:CheY-like chemotaxis protein
MSVQHGANSNPTQTVLVVDNLADVRGLIGVLLARRGYRVAEADGGEQAVAEARRVVPDLILMDLKMPGGMDGVAAAQAIRGDVGLRGVPIVAVTGDNTEYWRLKAREAGFDDYLVKPFEAGELEGVLERLLPNKSSVLH